MRMPELQVIQYNNIDFISFLQLQQKKRHMNSRLNWTFQEENLIKTLKQEDNIASWKKIAQILNEKFPDTSRTGKQCRDRYINYVRFSSETPKLVGWTQEDDRMLFKKFEEHGTKWVLISSEMAGRSQNNLKNRFYGAMRKIMRKIAKVEKEMKPKPKKTIKQKQLIRIFEQCRRPAQEQTQLKSNETQLYEKLLQLAISQEELISTSEVKEVIQMINSNNIMAKNTMSQKKSCTTEDISKQNDLSEAQSSTFEVKNQLSSEEMEEQLYSSQGVYNADSLKDSLRLDFLDMKIFENDLQFEPRRVEDDLFFFEDSFFY